MSRQDNSVSAYRLVESERLARWGRSESGEPCGMRAALEDYGLAPMGGATDLQFAESLSSFVQLRAVCNASSECSFASVIDHETCEATPGTAIAFDSRSKLLLLEANGDSYTELFYGAAKSLKKRASCDKHNCEIDVSKLRDGGPAE